MRVIVHRVDAPRVARVVMRGALDAVKRGVAQVDVGRRHVNLRPQDGCAVGQFPVTHLAQACQVFLWRAAAERAVGAGRGEVAARCAHLVGALLVHIGQACSHQRFGRAVHEVEVVAGVVQVAGAAHMPVETQPGDGFLDGVDKFLLFSFRVGVVKTQVAHAAIVACQAEVQADAFRVANVQVAVGLGRKAGADACGVQHAGGVVSGVAGAAAKTALVPVGALQVAFDEGAQEVRGRRRRGFGVGLGGVIGVFGHAIAAGSAARDNSG